jgi:hypothetical protein
MKSKKILQSQKGYIYMLLLIACSIFLLGLTQTVKSQCNPCNDPNYQVNKLAFWNACNIYKDNLTHNIITAKPVDISGTFEIDNNGVFKVKQKPTTVVFPNPIQSDLVSAYTFSQSTTTYASINTSGTLITSGCDDSYYTSLPIGFTFNYNGTDFTAFCVSCNGWGNLGTTGINNYYTPLCAGTPNCFAPFANDLHGYAAGNGLYYQTTGSAPNRVLTIEWYHWGFYYATGNEMDFEVKLYETSNLVQFVYKPETIVTTTGLQVGIEGATVADFNTRTETSSWSTTTAGNACSNCSYSPSNYPANGLTFTFSPPVSAPAPPQLVSPANNSTGLPLTDSLIWSASSGAVSYRVQLATDSLFTSLVVNDSTVTTTFRVVSGLTNNTKYYWRVNAKNSGGTSSYSAIWNFTTVVAAPGPPTLIAPANNSTGQSLTPLLDWSSVVTATSYRVQLGTDSTFVSTTIDTTVSYDSMTVPSGKLANNVKYYWHVRASNSGGNSSYSATWNFATLIIGISNNNNEIPKEFKLYHNYPNPFNPATMIKFDVPKPSEVSLVLYNTIGQELLTLVNSHFAPGSYIVEWNAANFPSGVYFYRITAGSFTDIKKMVLIK